MAASPSSRHPRRFVVGALVVLTLPLAGWAAQRHFDAVDKAADLAAVIPQAARPGYATSARCEACHPSQYHSWYDAFHRTMTQYATPAAVRADFDDVHLDGGGYDVHLYRRGDDYLVDMVDPLWRYEVDAGQRAAPAPGTPEPRVTRRISMVTGSHHMQAFWVPSNVGNGQLSVPFTYLFDDKRWVPRGEVFLHPPGQRHGEQVWNVSCILCHTVGGQPNALVGGKEVRTTVGELGIACEACHGPAEKHIAANQNPLRRYWLHLRHAADPTIVNPARLPAARAAQVCGQCHSLTDVSDEIYLGGGKKYVAGDELEKTQPLLRPLHPTPALERHEREDPLYRKNYFWADGTIRVSSRDYSGMIESKCMQSGKLWCGSCHSVHDSERTDLLAPDKVGDAQCLQCHAPIGEKLAAHTHHAVESDGSRCVNCHMPHTVYGLLKGIRQHRIDSPRVTGKSGRDERPNACNLCHLDKSLAWTAQKLAAWYGQPIADGLDAAPAGPSWLLSGDAVLRAIAAWHFGWAPAQKAAPVRDAVPYLVAALGDPYAAVRYVTGHALANIVPGIDFDYLASPEQRQAAGERIMQRWRGGLATVPNLTAMVGDIQRLIDKRDDTPVRAME